MKYYCIFLCNFFKNPNIKTICLINNFTKKVYLPFLHCLDEIIKLFEGCSGPPQSQTRHVCHVARLRGTWQYIGIQLNHTITKSDIMKYWSRMKNTADPAKIPFTYTLTNAWYNEMHIWQNTAYNKVKCMIPRMPCGKPLTCSAGIYDACSRQLILQL